MSTIMGPNEEKEVREVLRWAIGAEALQALNEPGTFEVIFNDDGRCWIESHSRGEYEARDRISRERLEVITALSACIKGVPVTASVDAMLPFIGCRIHSSLTAKGGRTVNIRKHSEQIIPFQSWIDENRISRNHARLLLTAVRMGASIVLAGMPGSGKTTFLNSLGNEIDPRERVISIEDDPELDLSNLTKWQAMSVTPGETTFHSLVKDALRQRPNRIIIGEARDGETLQQALKSSQTGVKGFLMTLHSGSAKEAIDYMQGMLSREVGVPAKDARDLLRTTVKVVVFMKDKRVREVLRMKTCARNGYL